MLGPILCDHKYYSFIHEWMIVKSVLIITPKQGYFFDNFAEINNNDGQIWRRNGLPQISGDP